MDGEDEGEEGLSIGLVRSEKKEAVDMEGDAALKDCCSHRDASDSGVAEFKKILKRGTQASIFTHSFKSIVLFP